MNKLKNIILTILTVLTILTILTVLTILLKLLNLSTNHEDKKYKNKYLKVVLWLYNNYCRKETQGYIKRWYCVNITNHEDKKYKVKY